jgi:hypothetical protein
MGLFRIAGAPITGGAEYFATGCMWRLRAAAAPYSVPAAGKPRTLRRSGAAFCLRNPLIKYRIPFAREDSLEKLAQDHCRSRKTCLRFFREVCSDRVNSRKKENGLWGS